MRDMTKKLTSMILVLALMLSALALAFVFGGIVGGGFALADEGGTENTDGENTDNNENTEGDVSPGEIEPLKAWYEDINWNAESLSYEILAKFVSRYPTRQSGTDSSYQAALGLSGIMSYMGFTPICVGSSDGLQKFAYKNPLTSITDTDQNVVFAKNGTDTSDGVKKRVVLGAHYDGLAGHEYNGKAFAGDGTIDNGSGVATLLALAYALKDESFEFDIYFVFFGAEQMGFFGSHAYVNGMTADEKDATLLMVDFNMVAGGDFLYLYTDEVKTVHSQFIKDTADEVGADIKLPPNDREPVYIAGDFLPYQHAGLLSDNNIFMNAGINTAHIFGYNWEIKNTADGREFAGIDNIVGTENDNINYFIQHIGESGIKKMDDVVKLVKATLKKEGFVDAMERSKAEKYDYSMLVSDKYIWIFTAVAFVVMAGLVVLVFFLLKKKDTEPKPYVPGDNSQGIPLEELRREMQRRAGGGPPPPPIDPFADDNEPKSPFSEFDNKSKSSSGNPFDDLFSSDGTYTGGENRNGYGESFDPYGSDTDKNKDNDDSPFDF